MANNIVSNIRKLSTRGPEMSMFLRSGSSTTYTTLDKIDGTVSIMAQEDTAFDELSIQLRGGYPDLPWKMLVIDTFEGASSTLVPNNISSAALGSTQADHLFLKLELSLSDAYPVPRVFRAGRTYNFNFQFSIPQKILSQASAYPMKGEPLMQQHLQLPPSLGRKRGPIPFHSAYDDLAPAMLSISYDVVAELSNDEGLIAGVRRISGSFHCPT